jgi:hypothetical protein
LGEEDRPKTDRTHKIKNRRMSYNMEYNKNKNIIHEGCTSCRYCSMFKEINNLLKKGNLSKKKFNYSSIRFGECKA